MEKTGKLTVTEEAINSLISTFQNHEKMALNFKKEGNMDEFYNYISYPLGIKNALERLGLIVEEDYDFNKAVE